MLIPRFYKVLPAALTLVLLTACTSSHYRESADAETYAAIAGKLPLVPGVTFGFDISAGTGVVDLQGLPVNQSEFAFLDREAASELGAHILSLNDALGIAFRHSKDYQSQKERLYLQALSLTFDRYRYTPTFAFGASTDYEWDAQDQFVTDMQGLTGMQSVNTTETLRTRTSLGSRVLLMGGGVLALTLNSNFTRFLTGALGEASGSTLLASFDQPLLRDFGTAVEAETLLQAERDLLYQLRDFTNYRKAFAVRIASQYYSVLLARETVRNNYSGLLAVNLSLEREQAFQAEGLRTLLQVGRLEQSALQQDLRWTASITRYQRSLDNFKILLGLDASASIVLDDNEMSLVMDTGLSAPLDLNVEQAVELALQTRLDLYNELDRVQDSARRVRVAANALAPALDLGIAVSVPGAEGNSGTELDFEDAVYTAGLDLDLPLDNKAERNAYRRSLIDYDAATRAYRLAVDGVKLDVYDTWRRMSEARKTYELSLAKVQINERRVEEAELRAELGLGDIQDTVDSQDDLTAARTDLVSAIVEHNIAKLEFWRDVGLLYVDENGQWEEGTDEP